MSPFNRFEVRGRIYYDQNEERIAIKEEVTLGDERDYYQDFAFYKQVSLLTLQISHPLLLPNTLSYAQPIMTVMMKPYLLYSELGTGTMLGQSCATNMS